MTYRLRGSVEPFVDRHGALYFVRPGAPDLVVRDPDAADIALVAALARDARSLPQLLSDPALSELDEDSLSVKLEALESAELMQTSDPAASMWLSDEDRERLSRQLLYL